MWDVQRNSTTRRHVSTRVVRVLTCTDSLTESRGCVKGPGQPDLRAPPGYPSPLYGARPPRAGVITILRARYRAFRSFRRPRDGAGEDTSTDSLVLLDNVANDRILPVDGDQLFRNPTRPVAFFSGGEGRVVGVVDLQARRIKGQAGDFFPMGHRHWILGVTQIDFEVTKESAAVLGAATVDRALKHAQATLIVAGLVVYDPQEAIALG